MVLDVPVWRLKSLPKITKRIVDALSPPAVGEAYTWDTELRGFGIRFLPSGVGTYLIRYRNARAQARKMVLGRVGTLTPDEARSLARERLAAVAKGEDPSANRRAARQGVTVRELCDVYLKRAEKGQIPGKGGRPKKSSTLSRDRSRITRHILPLLGNRIVADLTQADVGRFMRDVIDGKTALTETTGKLRGKSIVQGGTGAAARTVGQLGGILSFAVSEGIITANPVRGIVRPPDQKRKARLTPEAYARLGHALNAMEQRGGSRQALGAIRLLALTGCRRGEVLRLRWAEVDEAGQALRLEETKEGESVRPIGKAAIAVMQSLTRRPGSPFVLPGRDGKQPYGGLEKAWRGITAAGKLEGVTLHTLRHSYASVAGDLGYSESTIAALLGHAAGTVTGRYVHHLDTVLIAAANRVAEAIVSAIGAEQSPNAGSG